MILLNDILIIFRSITMPFLQQVNILLAILVLALCYPEWLHYIMCELRCAFAPVVCVVSLEPVMGFRAAVLTCRSTWANCNGSVCAAQ